MYIQPTLVFEYVTVLNLDQIGVRNKDFSYHFETEVKHFDIIKFTVMVANKAKCALSKFMFSF